MRRDERGRTNDIFYDFSKRNTQDYRISRLPDARGSTGGHTLLRTSDWTRKFNFGATKILYLLKTTKRDEDAAATMTTRFLPVLPPE